MVPPFDHMKKMNFVETVMNPFNPFGYSNSLTLILCYWHDERTNVRTHLSHCLRNGVEDWDSDSNVFSDTLGVVDDVMQ